MDDLKGAEMHTKVEKSVRMRWLVVGTVLVFGLALTASLWVWGRREVLRTFDGYFHSETLSESTNLRSYLDARLLFLGDLARHVELSGLPTRNGFDAYVSEELERVNGIQALEWAPLVTDKRRGALEAQLRQIGGSGFTERGRNGELKPEAPRGTYYPVFYLDPLKGNGSALGFDLGSSSPRLAAIEAARDSGQPQVTEPLTLVQETRAQAGFLIFVPVYARDLPRETVEQRRAAFLGVVLGVFRSADLMAAVLGQVSEKNLRIEIRDSTAPYKGGAFYVWGEPASNEPLRPPLLDRTLLPAVPSSEVHFSFAGRSWILHSRPRASFIEANLQKTPWQLVPAGLSLTALLAIVLYLLYTQKQRAEAQVQARSRELVESLEKLSSRESDLRSLLNSTAEAIYGIDLHGRCKFCNQSLLKMLGYPNTEAVVGRNMHELIHHSFADGTRVPEKDSRIFNAFRQGLLAHVEDEVLWRADGSSFPAEYWAFPQRVEEKVVGAVVTFIDITERKRSEQKIQELAYFDSLTKLPNRRLMMDRLRQAMVAQQRRKANGALLFIDLDHFKTLNDTFGHAQGDLLLQQVAYRLTAAIRKGDTVARLGGDEFIVILEGLSDNSFDAADQVMNIGKKILAAFHQPFTLTARKYYSSGSIGAVLFKDAPQGPDELLKLADIAMYQAKGAGRNTLLFYDPVVQANVKAHAEIEEDLRQAITHDELRLHYQAQNCRGVVTGAEALIRWEHPERGLMMPGEFIPLAEETDLILLVGRWVLEAACRQIVLWADRPETKSLMVAINVSAREFRQQDFVEQVLEVVDRSRADPRKLRLELTESMLLQDVDDVIKKINALKSRGLSFSLDDFGSGYSSLAYLSRLPIDELKIDQSFVRNILNDRRCAAIAKTIIALGQSMNLTVLAEGVETQVQREFLERIGCNEFQGYLFSRPVSAEDFVKLVRNSGQVEEWSARCLLPQL
jgi:diguanylate cyclase (GGDEF)-like protein/PAS domain S-box-containing protein